MNNTILITDTHYGIRQNSLVWLERQMDFINKQLIPYIRKNKIKQVIHLGDVFDIRSTINVKVADIVRDTFRKMDSLLDKFIIIAGNHDFYSPTSDSCCSIDIVLKDIGTHVIDKVLVDGENLYVPWYEWKEGLPETIKANGIKNVFTHTDITTPTALLANVLDTGVTIYSGHVHTPQIGEHCKNLGSCYSLTFNDSSGVRGAWLLSDTGLERIPNKHDIKFHKIYSGDLDRLADIDTGDYINIYLTQKEMSSGQYKSIIDPFCKTHKNTNIFITETIAMDSIDAGDCDINSVVLKNMEPHLLPYYKQLGF